MKNLFLVLYRATYGMRDYERPWKAIKTSMRRIRSYVCPRTVLSRSKVFYASDTFEYFYMKSKSWCCAHGVSIKWAGGAIRNLGRIQIGQLALSLQYTGGSWGGG